MLFSNLMGLPGVPVRGATASSVLSSSPSFSGTGISLAPLPTWRRRSPRKLAAEAGAREAQRPEAL